MPYDLILKDPRIHYRLGFTRGCNFRKVHSVVEQLGYVKLHKIPEYMKKVRSLIKVFHQCINPLPALPRGIEIPL